MSEKKGVKGTILVVDDMRSIRDMVDFIAGPMGYKIVKAADGLEGLRCFHEIEKGSPPLVLIVTDLNMPHMNGIEFIEKIRSAGSSVPILVLSTETEREKVEQGKRVGADGWAVKPINLQDFTEAVHLLTDGWRRPILKKNG